MGVGLGRLAVRRPAGVADADRAHERLGGEPRLEVLQLSLGAPAREPAVLERRDAGRVVAAVFEALQRVDDRARNRARPENAHNSAHRQDSRSDPIPMKQGLGQGQAVSQVTLGEGM